MARLDIVYKPSDYPGTPDDETKQAMEELFQHMFPGNKDPEIPGPSSAFATVARDPKLALRLIKVSDYILRDMPWTSQRKQMKQLAIQALNLQLDCEFSYKSHMESAKKDGVSAEKQACIPFWRSSNVFSDEERLVIEFSYAVVNSDVSDELFSRVVEQYGEQEALEFSIAVAWWSFWAMIINATGTNFDFGY